MDKLPGDVDHTRLESYLSTEEFEKVFSISKKQFYLLPKWQQHKLKKEKKLQ